MSAAYPLNEIVSVLSRNRSYVPSALKSVGSISNVCGRRSVVTKTAFFGTVAPVIWITSIPSMTSCSGAAVHGTVTAHGDAVVPAPVTPVDAPLNVTLVWANAVPTVTTRSLVVPGRYVSLPAPPTTTSFPDPAVIRSSPSPPSTVSLPSPASIVSSPLPPSIVSLPSPASISSAPSPPAIVSSPRPPAIVSSPARPRSVSLPSSPLSVLSLLLPKMRSSNWVPSTFVPPTTPILPKPTPVAPPN